MEKKKNPASSVNLWEVLVWVIVSLSCYLVLRRFLGADAITTHDNNYEVWLRAFDLSIKSGHLIPQWSNDAAYGLGAPLFGFYPPLFFYLAEIPRLLGASLVWAVKIAVGASVLAAFASCFWWMRTMKLPRLASALAGLIYLVAPYHLALIYLFLLHWRARLPVL